jgi:hypothetical protein
MKNPAEYARIVGGLASPTGAVKLADGETLRRQPATDTPDGSNRTISSELWQTAFAQFAVGNNVKWNNTNDSRSDGKWGIFVGEVDHAADALTGKDSRRMSIDDGDKPEDIVQAIADSTKAGNPVPVCMDWGEQDASGNTHPGHDVLFTRIDNSRAYYNNPWGQEESMSVKDLTQRIWWANFPKLGN